MIEILILSVKVHTEFLPLFFVSFNLISKYKNFQNSGLSIDVSLHIGSLLAVLVYFIKILQFY